MPWQAPPQSSAGGQSFRVSSARCPRLARRRRRIRPAGSEDAVGDTMVRTLRPSRASSQRLQRVHRAAVADHADHLRSGHATAAPGREPASKSHRAAHVLQQSCWVGGAVGGKETAARVMDSSTTMAFRDRHRDRCAIDAWVSAPAACEFNQGLRFCIDRLGGQVLRPMLPARPPSFSAARVMAWTRIRRASLLGLFG